MVNTSSYQRRYSQTILNFSIYLLGTVAVWRISETPVEATIQSVVPYTCKPFHDPTGFHEDQEQEPEDIIEQTAERDDSDPDEVDGGNEMEVDDDSTIASFSELISANSLTCLKVIRKN